MARLAKTSHAETFGVYTFSTNINNAAIIVAKKVEQWFACSGLLAGPKAVNALVQKTGNMQRIDASHSRLCRQVWHQLCSCAHAGAVLLI